jgi:environmental stress-induced protein Ves
MPWANGGGTTYQVAVAPADAALDDFSWRISLADIDTSGPFSSLPGIDRILVVIEGAGMVLAIDGAVRTIAPLAPVSFAGESVTTCELTAGPTRDLNVMTRRGACSASLVVVDLSIATPVVLDDGLAVVVVLDGQCDVEGTVLGLSPRDALVATDLTRLTGRATLAIVTIRDEPSTH